MILVQVDTRTEEGEAGLLASTRTYVLDLDYHLFMPISEHLCQDTTVRVKSARQPAQVLVGTFRARDRWAGCECSTLQKPHPHLGPGFPCPHPFSRPGAAGGLGRLAPPLELLLVVRALRVASHP